MNSSGLLAASGEERPQTVAVDTTTAASGVAE